jgi:hypothetical protein
VTLRAGEIISIRFSSLLREDGREEAVQKDKLERN